MLKKVRIKIVTDRTEMAGSLFEDGALTLPSSSAVPTHEESVREGRYHDDGTRVAISYEEGELSGMEGSRVTLSFYKESPALVTMLRTGSVKTALTFEAGRRHVCVYQTPYAPFDVCVQTGKVQNALHTLGTLHLDYVVGLKGAQPEHTKMTLTLLPAFDKPIGV